jgi:hypothetical protein
MTIVTEKRKKKKKLNRRDFLKITGGIMGMAIIATPIIDVFRKVDPNTVNQETGTS